MAPPKFPCAAFAAFPPSKMANAQRQSRIRLACAAPEILQLIRKLRLISDPLYRKRGSSTAYGPPVLCGHRNRCNMIYVMIGSDEKYGTACALHLTLFSRRSSAWPSPCSPRAESRAALGGTDKVLKTLLITVSLERSIVAGPHRFCFCAKFNAGLAGDNLNPLRANGRIKE